MKNAALIVMYALLILISIIMLTAVITGDLPIFTIIFPILFIIVAPWFITTRYFHSKNPEFPQGKLSLDAFNRMTGKLWKHYFKFVILPILIAIILLIILLIAVAITS